MRTILCLSAAVVAQASYNFITWGDWGTGSALQRELANRVNTFCAEDPSTCTFILSLGDNFYNGPNTTSDKRWKTEFMDMYNVTAPFEIMFGNHDYSGLLEAQLSFNNDTRWHAGSPVPSGNRTITIPEADMSIVIVDTPRACPSYMSAPYGDCTEECMIQLAQIGCTNETSLQCWLDHVAWLNETLAGLTTTWKFVAGHHPIDQEHMPYMAPALAAHGVQAFFAGHVHNMQHNTGNDGVQYFISGAGAFASALEGPNGKMSPNAHMVATATTGIGDANVPVDISGMTGREGLPADVKIGPSHDPNRVLTCPEGAVCAPMTNSFFANGPGFLALQIDNDASPAPVTTAQFVHWNGTIIYNFTFGAKV